MKSVTATDARRDWFRLLDEVAAGEVVVIDRRGHRLILKRDGGAAGDGEAPPDYSGLVEVRGEDDLELWGWEWAGPGEPLAPRRRDGSG